MHYSKKTTTKTAKNSSWSSCPMSRLSSCVSTLSGMIFGALNLLLQINSTNNKNISFFKCKQMWISARKKREG